MENRIQIQYSTLTTTNKNTESFKNFSFNQCPKQQILFFFFLGKSIFKSDRKLFSCTCIAWYKHSRGWENSRQLCKPSTSSRIGKLSRIPPNSLVFIPGYANTENVFYCLNKKSAICRSVSLAFSFASFLTWVFLAYNVSLSEKKTIDTACFRRFSTFQLTREWV